MFWLSAAIRLHVIYHTSMSGEHNTVCTGMHSADKDMHEDKLSILLHVIVSHAAVQISDLLCI